MSIEFTLGELKSIEESLKKLLILTLPIKISYKLSKVLAKISKELALLEEQRMNLVRKYGEENPETKEIRVQPDQMPAFINEFNELLQETVKFDFEPVSIDSVGDIEFSPLDMANLEKFFAE